MEAGPDPDGQAGEPGKIRHVDWAVDKGRTFPVRWGLRLRLRLAFFGETASSGDLGHGIAERSGVSALS